MSTSTISVRPDRTLIRAAAHSRRYLLVEVTAPPAAHERERPPVNIAFVLDRSGSMSGEKIRLARLAVEEAVARLQARDRFGIVVYDDVVDVVMPSLAATGDAKRNALSALAEIDARGSTNLGDGWLRGCEQVALAAEADGVNRTLLLTDGLANVGMTDADELAGHAAELRARGVATSTFGVGDDFDEALLQRMADAGGGHFYYIENAGQIRDHVTSEVAEALEVVARDVTLEVTARESIRVEAITPHPFTSGGGRTSVRLGDLVADQKVAVVLQLGFPYGEVGQETGVIVGLTDRDGVLASATEPVRVTWTWADNAANDAQARDRDVDRAVARQFASRARQEAVRLNRHGDFAGAQLAVGGVAKRIRGYAGRDAELRRIADELEQHEQAFAAPMPEMQRKLHFAVSSSMARSRDPKGRAIREQR